jgi:glucan biosynthesis protein C
MSFQNAYCFDVMERNVLNNPAVTQFTPDQKSVRASDQPEGRLVFADYLKVALITLVVLHHLSVIYAANTPFYYVEPAYSDVAALLILVIFQLLNQAYFMGFFFLLSGYFTPGSFDRKGLARFLKDRLLRLGIPLIVFMFVLNPLASTGIWFMPASLTGITTPLTWQQYPGLIGFGPLWFVVMLLIFYFGYAAWRLVKRNRPQLPETATLPPGNLALGVFILALASYLIRIVLPLGKYLLHFPSLAYLPQYVSFFILGVVAYRRDWLRTIPNSTGKTGFLVALGATLILFPLALSGKLNFLGNGTWQSAVYALWDSIFSVGMCLGLITFFRSRFNHSSSFGQFLSRHAYTVFIVHAPVIVYLAIALRNLQLEHLLKFGLMALVGVPLCFAAAFLVRKIPFASRIL